MAARMLGPMLIAKLMRARKTKGAQKDNHEHKTLETHETHETPET